MSKRSNPIHNTVSFLIVALLFSFYGEAAFAQNTAFTYQGRLTDGGSPATGQYDLQFQIFAAPSGGTALGTVQLEDRQVTNGIFSVQLNFGAINFNDNGAQFLEIGVRPFNQTGAYTPLTPRQQITSTPYAIRSLNAGTADGLSVACVNCVTSSQISSVAGSQVSGAIPVASVPDLSLSYIKNIPGIGQQSGSFNIDGGGNANIFNATTQFNIGGSRVLSTSGANNFFAGVGAGQSNTGSENTFVGRDAGLANNNGRSNSFFGSGAGQTHLDGSWNAFFGSAAGFANRGSENSFFGESAGFNNTLGSANVFFGRLAGETNTFGTRNVFIGYNANPLSNSLTNATAIGADTLVSLNNSLVLGNNANVGIGTSAPQYKLHVVGENVRVENNSFPRFSINFTDGAVDAKRWQTYASTNTLVFSALNDAEDFERSWLRVIRGTGTDISSVAFPNGNVGIGTSAPEQALHVNGTEILSTGSGSGFKFRDRGSTSSADDWVWFSSGNIARFFRAGVGDLLTVQLNPNVFLTKYRFTGQVQATTLYATGAANPLIISSLNQTCWAITVDNNGQLGTHSVPCP